jgi:N-methylhydantoinase A
VPLADGPLEPDAVATAFHEAHRALYGYDFAHDGRQQVEWVNLRVTGVLPIARPAAQRLAPPPAVPAGPTVRRPVCFDGRDFVEAAVFDRAALGAGAIVEGPAIIEEYGSTVPLHPGFRARVDEFGDGVTR